MVIIILLAFKNYEDFKGGRGRMFRGKGRRNRTFNIIDVVGIVLVAFYLFINSK